MSKENRVTELCEYDEAERLVAQYVQSSSAQRGEGTRDARIDVIVGVHHFHPLNLSSMHE